MVRSPCQSGGAILVNIANGCLECPSHLRKFRKQVAIATLTKILLGWMAGLGILGMILLHVGVGLYGVGKKSPTVWIGLGMFYASIVILIGQTQYDQHVRLQRLKLRRHAATRS